MTNNLAIGQSVFFSYDSSGNRINKISKSQISPVFISPQKGSNYQWQQNSGGGFQNLVNNSIYYGANSIALILNKPPTNWYGYLYRCVVNTTNGQIITPADTLKFTSEWTGKSDIAWENSANWCCGVLPDSSTNVLIPKGTPFYPTINSDPKVRSLKLDSTSSVILSPGRNLIITH